MLTNMMPEDIRVCQSILLVLALKWLQRWLFYVSFPNPKQALYLLNSFDLPLSKTVNNMENVSTESNI